MPRQSELEALRMAYILITCLACFSTYERCNPYVWFGTRKQCFLYLGLSDKIIHHHLSMSITIQYNIQPVSTFHTCERMGVAI